MFNIPEELKKIPGKPGVYLMHDARDEIIYIGKAKNLKNRVNQYFQTSRTRSPKIEKMVSLIEYFEYIVTDSETEALILENNLIKDHRPRYNTMLKDDKTYPYIKLTLSEEFPRLFTTRNIRKDKDKYYGPYPNVGAANATAELLQKVYKLRTCSKVFPRDINKDRPCLNYHIGRCDGPCTGCVSREDYAERIRNVRKFLEGTDTSILDDIRKQMMDAASRMEYEKAGKYKELLESAALICRQQKMEINQSDNRDILGLAREGFDAIMQVFFIRDGKLLDREHFYLKPPLEESEEEIVSSFVKQYYSGTPFLPSEVHLPVEIEDADAISEWLTEKAGRKVSLVSPKKGAKEKMLELAKTNAQLVLDKDKEKVRREQQRTKGAVSEISKMLGINYAERIESYDISNTAGYDSVGSMVVFSEGTPKRNDYRKFKIKSVIGPNDFASMAEVITRRFEHREWALPDMLLIDGGKGQVSAVCEALEKLAAASDAEYAERILNIPVCGMVKDDHHRTRGLLYHDREYEMDRSKEPFKLITRIQDETHRFAIEYHKQIRGKGQVHSILDDIEGIGPKRRLALIRHFKSLDAIMAASVDELAEVEGMNRAAAEKVAEFFKGGMNNA